MKKEGIPVVWHVYACLYQTVGWVDGGECDRGGEGECCGIYLEGKKTKSKMSSID